jgi:Fe2+ transport system protein FeoA
MEVVEAREEDQRVVMQELLHAERALRELMSMGFVELHPGELVYSRLVQSSIVVVFSAEMA